MDKAAVLTANNLQLWRGDRHVLRGVSFSIREGEALHVWGPNGCGKTSLLRAICGLLPAEEGEIRWRGMPTRSANSDYARALAYLAHDIGLKGDLTARENLRFSVGLKNRVDEMQLRAMLAQMGVEQCADLPCRVLSAGQRRRVALCRVMLSQAQLWVLDEPFTNLDSMSSERVAEALSAHLESGGVAAVAAHQGLALRAGTVTRLGLV